MFRAPSKSFLAHDTSIFDRLPRAGKSRDEFNRLVRNDSYETSNKTDNVSYFVTVAKYS